MADSVVTFTGVTTADIPPDAVLAGAVGKLATVLILGTTKDGQPYYAGSSADDGEIILIVERFKAYLLDSHTD